MLTSAEHAAGNAYFIKIQPQAVVAVVKVQRNFRHAKRTPFAAAAENNVFHFTAAQIFGALFAQHPAHGIGDIAFAAAVRAYNCRYDLKPYAEKDFKCT